MRVTMLGLSGSGKTTYMSAMSEAFYFARPKGFGLKEREGSLYSIFQGKNSLYNSGEFPAGTNATTNMSLELLHEQTKLVDIDWIDYRGDAVVETARDGTDEDCIKATLMVSDIILVFADAVLLNQFKSNIRDARTVIGANDIIRLLIDLKNGGNSRNPRIIFLLTKVDSDTVKRDEIASLTRFVYQIYEKFFIDTFTPISLCPVFPVGACGFGKVTTTPVAATDRNQIPRYDNQVPSRWGLSPINITSSFAAALLLCLEKEMVESIADSLTVESELEKLRKKNNVVRHFIDKLLFGLSFEHKIESIAEKLAMEREQIKNIASFKGKLEALYNETLFQV
ncbi:hypothetical protein FACS1894217_01950 [Clostridia bacterium]|nr:hypothetical protein FACS1894217_01950 [Clostridia bacterium]